MNRICPSLNGGLLKTNDDTPFTACALYKSLSHIPYLLDSINATEVGNESYKVYNSGVYIYLGLN